MININRRPLVLAGIELWGVDIAIAFLAHRFAQPVAQVEGELLAVLVAQVALRVVTHAHYARAGRGLRQVGQMVGAVVVVVVTRRSRHMRTQVVLSVVAVPAPPKQGERLLWRLR